MDTLPAVVFEYTIFSDGTRDFTYLSPRCEEILGISREVLLTGIFPMKKFIYEKDYSELQKQIGKSISELKEFRWEGRIENDDRIIWIEAKGTPIRLDNGTVVCSGLIADISKRKGAEERAREADKKYKDLVEFLPVGIGIHTKGKLVYANKYAAEMLGAKTSEELIGKEVINFIHPDFRDIVLERIQMVRQGKSAPQIEEKYVRLDGEVIDVQSSALPFFYNGEFAVQNIAFDITAHKAAEASSKRAETLFTQLFNNSPLAIVMLDITGNVIKVNHGFEETFGYSFDEVKGKSLNPFIVPNELEEEGNDLNSLISNYQVARIETVRKTKKGDPVSVIIYGVPARMEDQTIGIFGVYVDITERKKVEEELKTRNSELDNFVYKVSHDLRAPLSSILGLVNLARLPNNTDNLADYLKIVGKKAEQLDHFIGDVLSHSKNLKMDVRYVKIELEAVIEQTFSELTYLKGADTIGKQIQISGGDFYSDLWRIKEIFRNLISNAIKYRNQRIDSPFISIKIDVTFESAKIIFEDNGIGIDKDNLSSIYEMFYRASELSDGSGLGLYIVKNAIDKLGGTIETASKLNVGTTFTIVLPNAILQIDN